MGQKLRYLPTVIASSRYRWKGNLVSARYTIILGDAHAARALLAIE